MTNLSQILIILLSDQRNELLEDGLGVNVALAGDGDGSHSDDVTHLLVVEVVELLAVVDSSSLATDERSGEAEEAACDGVGIGRRRRRRKK